MRFFLPHTFPARSLLKILFLGLLCGWKILAAQEIYDEGHHLFVAEGTVLHVPATVPEPEQTHPVRKTRRPGKISRASAVKKPRDSEKLRQNEEAQETAYHAATGFSEKKGREITIRPEEARYGILIPAASGKTGGLPAEDPFPAAKILSAADVIKHKYLYKEARRHDGHSCPYSCRPPPTVS